MKKTRKEDRINKQNITTMITKACSSALAGIPISLILNIIITIPITAWALSEGLHSIYIALILLVPFFIMSVFRQTLIDYVYAVYNIDINPSNLIKKSFRRLLKR